MRGQGKGPMGSPTKEDNTMDNVDKIVDEILLGDYKKVKLVEQAGDLVDVILDSCGKLHGKKKKSVKEGSEKYQTYFKSMLKKHGYNSPADIPADKKKEFFNAVDAGWKGEKVAEIANTVDHVPDESPEGEHDKIKDQLGKDEKKIAEVENALDSEPKDDGDEQLSAVEDEMSKEQATRTESAEDLVRKAFKEIRELKRVSHKEMKDKVSKAKAKCAKIEDRKKRQACIFKHLQEDLVRSAFKEIREEKAI